MSQTHKRRTDCNNNDIQKIGRDYAMAFRFTHEMILFIQLIEKREPWQLHRKTYNLFGHGAEHVCAHVCVCEGRCVEAGPICLAEEKGERDLGASGCPPFISDQGRSSSEWQQVSAGTRL